MNIVIIQLFDPTKLGPTNTCQGIALFVVLREGRAVSLLEIMEIHDQVHETSV
jgi:hypothetical protein